MSTDPTATPLLDIAGLSVELLGRSGSRRILDTIDLSVQPTDILAIVGESGSGKSVTVSAVLGLLPANIMRVSAGSIRFDAEDLLHSRDTRRRVLRKDIAFITQNSLTSLNPVHTIGSQLLDMIAFRNGVGRRQALVDAGEWLVKVGIADVERVLSSYPHNLSGGMRQRVVIAMAISSRPRLLIADEPTTALDTITQLQVLNLLRDINTEFGTAIIVITHDFGVVSYLSKRVAVMHRGRIVEEGPTRRVLEAPKEAYSRSLIAAVPQLDLIS
ncbi:ABC transporter ATP-binding protein [Sinorhizobium sp. RAC02]|uniref:ABC transporter ATP-binding protein n=1 Tax=Sinorhizobium sp. RAC02 TaxID=1842534 RepID=UPI00083D348A|nr:ABC transporter ATP-binding protein [Sinorhizobium sp. RAC02]AOF93775.1 ABC transporter family protein [Sinorhizobium sp. RAC02]